MRIFFRQRRGIYRGIYYDNRTGSKYDGFFLDGKENGLGICCWSNGMKYEGNYVDGEITGIGTYTWKNGHYFIGNFVDGLRNGKGIFCRPNGDTYRGDFLNDRLCGKISPYENLMYLVLERLTFNKL